MIRQRYRVLTTAAIIVGSLVFACKSDDEKLGDDQSPSAETGANNDGGSSVVGRDGATGSSNADAAARPGQGNDSGGNQRPAQACPATRPANGSACVSGRGDCTIGNATCDCSNDTNTWVCWEPSDCPSVAPAERSACSIVGIQCDIPEPNAALAEDGLECECTAQGWDCGRQVCPAAEPTPGAAACEGGDGVCTYGGRICDCRSKAWICWNASDCPAAPPAAQSACPVERMICPYASANDECECTKRGWECESQEEEEEEEEERDASTRAPDAATTSDAGVSEPTDAGQTFDAAS